MKIAIIGTGYVGLVTGTCFAETGNEVICVDIDERKLALLRQGKVPFYEPGLAELLERNAREGRLRFTQDLPMAVQFADMVFIAVGTPQDEDGSADLTHVVTAAEQIGQAMNGEKVVVTKSTVPIGTSEKVRQAVAKHAKHAFEVASNPEFLKEGAAVDDFMFPDRIVVGTDSAKVEAMMRDLYAPYVRTENPILFMDIKSAEMTKYAANAMLATRISFMNEIANLCERAGADVDFVRKGIGADKRIGYAFLFPGLGYGGSCFPKDVRALIQTAREHQYNFQILRAVDEVNLNQRHRMLEHVYGHFMGQLAGKRIAIWGLSFKPRTDDVREAPALDIIRALLEHNASVAAFDPVAIETAQERLPEGVIYAPDALAALDGADALIICTEWNEFRHPDFGAMKKRMKAAVIFDGRNLFSPAQMEQRGWTYVSVGRRPVGTD